MNGVKYNGRTFSNGNSIQFRILVYISGVGHVGLPTWLTIDWIKSYTKIFVLI